MSCSSGRKFNTCSASNTTSIETKNNLQNIATEKESSIQNISMKSETEANLTIDALAFQKSLLFCEPIEDSFEFKVYSDIVVLKKK